MIDLRYVALGPGRADYLRLATHGLVEPARIIAADEDTLRACVGGSRARLEALRVAVDRMTDNKETPDFAAVLAVSVD